MKRCHAGWVGLWTFLVLCVGWAGQVRADEVTLVRDGRPLAIIVLPAQTEHETYLERRGPELVAELRQRFADEDDQAFEARREKALAELEKRWQQARDEEVFAAEELQAVLEQISGARLPIERVEGDALPDGPAILLGTQLARQAGLGERIDQLDKDGLLTVVQGDKLILSGHRARGTLYAAYDFLESLGARWVFPGEHGALYPSLETITTEVDMAENPSHRERYWWCTYGHQPEYELWTLRNKGNFVRTLDDPKVAQGHALSQPLGWGASRPEYQETVTRKVQEQRTDEQGNTVTEWVEKEVTSLPDEFYAMQQGKPTGHTPNMANPKVWDLYADFYINSFDNNPFEDYASASAEDGLVLDDRPESQRLTSQEFDWMLGAPSATDRIWFFLNRILERTTKVYPDKKLGVLVYANNMAPPRMEQVHRNMALVIAPLGVSPLHHVRDPKSKTNRTYREWLEDWMLMAEAAGAETYYYDYEPLGYCWNMAMICPRWAIIGKNYPWFHELGLDGHTTQGYDDWASSGLNNYLMQRLYWDVNEDYKDIMADYARARFGAAADAMMAYYQVYEDRMAQIPDLYSNEVWDNHLILTPEVRQAAREQLDKAVRAADTERAKAHVQMMVDLQRSTDAMADAIEHADATGEFGEAARMMEVCWEVRDKLNQLYPNYMNSTRLDDKQTFQFFSGGIYNQYLGFQKRIDNARASLILPRHWKGSLDTRNHAFSLGYHKPEVSVEHLEDQDVTICPDVKYQTQREPAAFFYRAEVEVPKDFPADGKATLFFPSVIAKGLQVWVNGEPVKFDYETYQDTIRRGPDYFWINYDHELSVDVSGMVKPGRTNTIAFRVYKAFDFGGTYRRVVLLAE